MCVDEDEDDLADAIYRLELNENLGLHEAIHAVVWRVLGEDIAEVSDQGDHLVVRVVLNRPVNPGDVIGTMAPEVYMTIYGVAFTVNSVSEDRRKVQELLSVFPDPEKVRQQVWQALEKAFACPHIQAAIHALTLLVDTVEVVKAIPGANVNAVVDPLIKPSPIVMGLRSLKEIITRASDSDAKPCGEAP